MTGLGALEYGPYAISLGFFHWLPQPMDTLYSGEKKELNSMNNFKLTIAYDGAKYKGWQKLGGDDADKTVQGKIEAVLSKCFSRTIEINGASRTDAGVHALEQIANFKVKSLKCIPERLPFTSEPTCQKTFQLRMSKR